VPATRGEVEQALAEVDGELIPATPTEIVTLLGQLLVVLPSEKLNAMQEKQKFAAYLSDLAPYPAAVLEQAIATHRQTQKWFPKPAEIIKHADPLRARLLFQRKELRLRLKPREKEVRPDRQTRKRQVEAVRKEFHIPDKRGAE